jgi:hypothetical protein
MVKSVALNPNASLEKHEARPKPRIKQDRPAYEVINTGFYDHKDRFRPAGSLLYYDGEPNQNLFPLNKMANDRMNLFIDKLNGLGHEVAKKEKRGYIPQATKEWVETDEIEVPMVEHVFGVPKFDDGKDEIR